MSGARLEVIRFHYITRGLAGVPAAILTDQDGRRTARDLHDLGVAVDDLARVGAILDSRIVLLVHRGMPQPKERPRVNTHTGHAYTPTRTKQAEADLVCTLTSALYRRAPLSGPVALRVRVFLPGTSRGDWDNYGKLVSDAGNQAGIWRDDVDVMDGSVGKVFGSADPRTVIAIAPMDPTRVREC